MVDSEIKEFAKTLLSVADYYGKELSTGVVDLYWQGLREFDLAAVQKALWTHAKNPDTGQWMPKIADISKVMGGRTTDQAAIAWSKVDGAVRRVGTYSDVVFDDPIIHRVLADMGGWVHVGGKDEKEWPFVAKEFENRYRGYRMRDEVPEYQPVLTGIANAHNSTGGFRLQAPMLIGNEARAKQVMLAGTNEQLVQMRLASDTITEQAIKRIERAA